MRPQSGMTLIEVMVALTLFTLGILGLLQTHHMALRSLNHSRDQLQHELNTMTQDAITILHQPTKKTTGV